MRWDWIMARAEWFTFQSAGNVYSGSWWQGSTKAAVIMSLTQLHLANEWRHRDLPRPCWDVQYHNPNVKRHIAVQFQSFFSGSVFLCHFNLLSLCLMHTVSYSPWKYVHKWVRALLSYGCMFLSTRMHKYVGLCLCFHMCSGLQLRFTAAVGSYWWKMLFVEVYCSLRLGHASVGSTWPNMHRGQIFTWLFLLYLNRTWTYFFCYPKHASYYTVKLQLKAQSQLDACPFLLAWCG